jgi:DNA-binding HxlR family transcriptional regulator
MRAPADAYRERAACPLYTAIAVIDGRWKPMIFQRLSEQPRGFAELRRAMPHVTAKVLREQLRQMVADDLIAREPLTPARFGVRYRVTRHGRSLRPVFAALWRWGRAHLARAGSVDGTIAFSPARSAV